MITLPQAKEKVKIDKFSLNTNVEEQAVLFLEVAEAYTKAAYERDVAYDQIKVIDSMTALSIRQEAANTGAKTTEGLVNEKVMCSEDHKKAHNDYLLKKQLAEEWQIVKEAYQQRANMLKIECELYISGYFSLKAI